MPIHSIADPSDPRLDDYRNIPDAELLRERGLFVAEGRLVVRRLLTASRFTARSVLTTAAAFDSLRDLLEDIPLPVYLVAPSVLNVVAGFSIHRGCLAIGERRADADWRTIAEAASTLVVLERVANADNVGAVFRNAAAFGAGAVLLEGTCVDPLYRKAIRTSMGAALAMPFARLEPWPEALHALRDLGITVVGLATDAALTVRDAATKVAARRVAILLGHEGEGLTPQARAACDHVARIPMTEAVDSLNVATAAAVALYEIRRNQ